MEKKLCYFFLIMLSILLSQSKECLCLDTNTTAITCVSDEFPNSFNEQLLSQIELLSARLEHNKKFFEAQNRTSLDGLPDSLNENLISQIEMLNARLDEHAELIKAQNKNSFSTPRHPRNCVEIAKNGHASGIFTIQVIEENPFQVVCNDSHGGGWIVIQRRQDGSIDFYRGWDDYKNGFGNLEGEFFIGLDKLHALTKESPQELLIVMSDFEGETRFANYGAFAIGDESEAYVMKVLGEYSGDAGDSLRAHYGQKFSTKDRDNDGATVHCAEQLKGAWWYEDCHLCNLNGLYLMGKIPARQSGQGIDWHDWHGYDYSLKYVQMMIRPIMDTNANYRMES